MLVSVLLCNQIRHDKFPDAVACYLSQEWKEKELIVVDSGECRDLLDAVPQEELVYCPTNAPNLAIKRNIGCRVARGSVIIHFDSDDWSAPTRISHSVEHLIGSGARVGGYHKAMFWDEVEQKASCYKGDPNYSWGPTLCYWKDYAVENPWPEFVYFAEDNNFIRPAQQSGQLKATDGTGQIVVRLHARNGRRPIGGEGWPYIPTESLPHDFLALIGKAA